MRYFTRLFLAALIMATSHEVGHAIPHMINYQGVLLDGSGHPIKTTTTAQFRLWNGESGGTELWTESQTITPDEHGGFTVLLGMVNAIPEAVFAGEAYLGTTIAPDAEMTPRVRLVAVAYAFRVGTVDGASGGTIGSKVSIGPGHTNTGINAFVAGEGNTVSGDQSVVVGGVNNVASGYSSAIGGGLNNATTGPWSTVGGGGGNTATSHGAVVGGGGTNLAGQYYATVSGGLYDSAQGYFSTIGGGSNNLIQGYGATVGGGRYNTVNGDSGTVAGGTWNGSGRSATVGGGFGNLASGEGSVVAGGSQSVAGGSHAAIGGGYQDSAISILGGVASGFQNVAGFSATDTAAFVGGGFLNRARSPFSGILGGAYNRAWGSYSSVLGGMDNWAEGNYASALGGRENHATGAYSVAFGKKSTASAAYSLAAGCGSYVGHLGSFVWSDCSSDTGLSATTENQFAIRATGGMRVVGEITSEVNNKKFYMVPRGAIIMWSGPRDSIPAGWHLCDGGFGTPDLQNRFILGCPRTRDPGTTGGSASHSHDLYTGWALVPLVGPAEVPLRENPYVTESANHLPPYYELAFIMKL
jgi:hypothetical protein